MVEFRDLKVGQPFVHILDEDSDDAAYVFKKVSETKACHFARLGRCKIIWGETNVSIDSDRRVQPLAFEPV